MGNLRHRVRPWTVWVAALAVLLAAGIWRYAPRPAVPPSAEMRRSAAGLSAMVASASASPPRPSDAPKTDRERLIVAAYGMLGVPYKWAAKGPEAYDCSGFTAAAYRAIGFPLPDGSFNQAAGEQPLRDPGELVAGDLLLYRWAGKNNVSHVTMYAGDGWVIGTGSPGQPHEVVLYPLSDDFRGRGDVITYRHITLPDER